MIHSVERKKKKKCFFPNAEIHPNYGLNPPLQHNLMLKESLAVEFCTSMAPPKHSHLYPNGHKDKPELFSLLPKTWREKSIQFIKGKSLTSVEIGTEEFLKDERLLIRNAVHHSLVERRSIERGVHRGHIGSALEKPTWVWEHERTCEKFFGRSRSMWGASTWRYVGNWRAAGASSRVKPRLSGV